MKFHGSNPFSVKITQRKEIYTIWLLYEIYTTSFLEVNWRRYKKDL